MTTRKRTFRKRDVGVPREHPDGGTFYLLPVDLKKAAQLNDEIESLSYELADGVLAAARSRLQVGEGVADDRVRVLAIRAALPLPVKLDDEGKPVKKTWLLDSDFISARVAIVRRYCVAKVGDFTDGVDGPDLEMDEEMIEAVLCETSTRAIEKEIPLLDHEEYVDDEGEKKRRWVQRRDGDGRVLKEKVTAPANEAGFEWALNESMKLGSSRQETEEKNS